MSTTTTIQQPSPAATPRRRGWKPAQVIGAAGGSVLALLGALMALGGVAVIAIHLSERDDDGFYTSGTELIQSDGAAVVTEDLDLGSATDTAPDELLGSLRVTAQSSGGGDVFLGVAPKDEAAAYLAGVQHSVLTDVDDPAYREVSGDGRASAPADQSFWAAQSQGNGEQVLDWDVEGGQWAIVLMNADGSSGVAADSSIGIEIGWLIWAGVGLLVVGLLLAGGGTALALVMRREANKTV